MNSTVVPSPSFTLKADLKISIAFWGFCKKEGKRKEQNTDRKEHGKQKMDTKENRRKQ